MKVKQVLSWNKRKGGKFDVFVGLVHIYRTHGVCTIHTSGSEVLVLGVEPEPNLMVVL